MSETSSEPASTAAPPSQGGAPEPTVIPPAGAASAAHAPAETSPSDRFMARALTSQTNTIGSMHGKQVTIAEQITQINGLFPDSELLSMRSFSAEDANEISESHQEELDSLFVGDAGELDRLLEHLRDNRVLLLCGPHRSGRTTMATVIGARLARREHVERRTWLVPALDRSVRIDLRRVVGEERLFARRLVVFRNVLSRGNRDLLALFDATERAGWDELRERLRKQGAYLIFTATTAEVERLERQLTEHALHRVLPPLSEAQLTVGLHGLVAHRRVQRRIDDLGAEAITQAAPGLVRQLGTMPLLAGFVDYLARSASPHGSLDVMVRQFRAATHWRLPDLIDDPDAWSGVVVLGLAHCVAGTHGVPWVEFETLRRLLAPSLWPPEERPPAPGASEHRASDRRAAIDRVDRSDDSLIERWHAVIEKDDATLADVIHFVDDARGEELWTALRRQHRRALLAVLPALRVLAAGDGDEPVGIRMLAAQIVGRIGELDPDRIVGPLVDRWSRSPDRVSRMALGWLFQGILSSGSAVYRTRYLQRVTALGHPAEDATPDDRRDALLTAIAIHARIGVFDLAYAMRELGEIARHYLAPVMRDNQAIARFLDRASKARGPGEQIVFTVDSEAFRDFAERLYSYGGGPSLALRGALTTLSLVVGPIEVCWKLREWQVRGGIDTTLLVAMMFLDEGGIAASLESRRVDVVMDGYTYTGSPLVLSLAENDDAVHRMALFLSGLYDACKSTFTVHSDLQAFLLESFLRRLTVWAHDALDIPRCRLALLRLFAVLGTRDGTNRSNDILRLLDRREFTAPGRLHAFAVEVRRKILESNITTVAL